MLRQKVTLLPNKKIKTPIIIRTKVQQTSKIPKETAIQQRSTQNEDQSKVTATQLLTVYRINEQDNN